MIEGLQLNIPQRMGLVRVVLTIALVVSVVLSFNLWAGERSFPYAPVTPGFYLQAPFDIVLTCLMLLALLGSLVLRGQRLIIFFSLLIAGCMVCCDINRLQPWFYIYASMLLVFVFYNGRVDDPNKFTSYFISLQIIIASVYFFCGISQLNSQFVDTQFSEIIAPLKSIVSERQFLFFKKLGVIVPYLLMFIGLALIISPLRYLAITLGLLLHLLLLVFLFPSRLNHNYALWFSNLPFAVLLLLLFSGKTKQRYFSPSYLAQIPLFYVVLILFVAMPFFNRSGYWPDYLSSNFKSGKNKNVVFNVDQELYKRLPLYQKSFCRPAGDVYMLEYNKWCDNELKVECYPEMPVFNSIYGYLHRVKQHNVKETQLALAVEK